METEEKIMIEIGTVVPCVTKNEEIATWKNRSGSFFCKVSKEITLVPRWVAVENPIYQGKGLIVFLDRKPQKGELVKVIKIGKTCAVGKVIAG